MMWSFDRIFVTGMFVALAALAIMANTECPALPGSAVRLAAYF